MSNVSVNHASFDQRAYMLLTQRDLHECIDVFERRPRTAAHQNSAKTDAAGLGSGDDELFSEYTITLN